ncbi:MAG: Asp-tRNA(Asn)/Glu-tRNA(Gln) amidotransferase subunit GatA [bacterium]
MKLNELTAKKLQELLLKKEIKSEEIVKAVFEQIELTEKSINAYLSTNFERAIKQAKIVDEKIAKKEKIGLLAGIPIAIKDNICEKGIECTCASKILSGFIAPYSAFVIEKLQKEDAVFIGRTNLDEFAMGSSTENSAYKITHNPKNLDYVPGGSSGGSAAAIASNEAILALGSDTGGSIRQPASLCGIVGLKPSYGRVSRYGLIAFASSLDQIGPLTKNVEDCALLMNILSGFDQKDSTSCNISVPDYTKNIKNDIKEIKVGVPKEYFIKGMNKEVEENVLKGIKILENMGAKIEEISLPHTEYAIATYYIIAVSEASSNLARFDGVQYGYRSEQKNLLQMYGLTRDQGFGKEVKRRIMLGTYVLSAGYYDAYYLKAQKVRNLIKQDFDKAFEKVDVIITPTSSIPPFKIGENIDDPLSLYLADIFTVSINLAGLTGISVPCGLTQNNLPIGMQIIGKPFDEETILKVAYNFEKK